MELKLIKSKKATGKRVESGRDVYNMMQEEAMADRECFWVLHLNIRDYVIEKELVSLGTLSKTLAAPREVFKSAIINSSYAVVLVHNHPSGYPQPSYADEENADRFIKAGELLGIPVVDDIIIGRYGYYSFYEHIREQEDYRGQKTLFIEQEAVCVWCGQWVKNDEGVEREGLIYCPYCWKVCFGESGEDWIPEI